MEKTVSRKISYERVIWEIKRALYSFRRSPAPALMLLQLPVLAFVYSKGSGPIYMDMLGILAFITFLSWFFVSVIHGNRQILIYTLILLSVGTMLQCIFIKEAILKNPDTYSEKALTTSLQLQYAAGFAAAIAASFIYYKWSGIASMNMCRILFLISSGISLLTLALGAGVGGVRNWIRIGGLSIQTTELTKLMYIFLAAGLLGTVDLPSGKRLRAFYLVSIVQSAFLALQGEFGTLLLIILVFFAFLFLFVPDTSLFIKTVAAFAGCILCGGFALWQLEHLAKTHARLAGNRLIMAGLSAYSKLANRFIYWKHPEKDPLGLGYQLLKARESIMLGGWFGTASVTDLPVKTSDLVYPALIQRCGMIFALLVFFIFVLLWLEGMRLFVRKSDRFHQMVAAGIVIMLFVQTIIIIAGSTGLCPLTGITLPFISKGGSSLLISFVMTGILITISGNVSWKGTSHEETEEFFKESPVFTKLRSDFGHFGHAVADPYLRFVSRCFKRSRPGKGEGETKDV